VHLIGFYYKNNPACKTLNVHTTTVNAGLFSSSVGKLRELNSKTD